MKRSARRNPKQQLVLCGSLLLILMGALGALSAPAEPEASGPDWESAAGSRAEFDTASIVNHTVPVHIRPGPIIPLGLGDIYTPSGGRFVAVNHSLFDLIVFAYKVTNAQADFLLPQLPRWAVTERFDMEATADGTPTKDQMRLMMQALLAERFKLELHYETRLVPAYALIMDTGKFGPLLEQHDENSPCSTSTLVRSPAPSAPPETRDIRFPLICGGFLSMNASVPGRVRVGARNVTIELFADSIGGNLDGVDRPVVDRTGLSGTYDIAVEFTPESILLNPKARLGDDSGPLTFRQALQQQLGLKLQPAGMVPSEFPVLDNAEPLTN